MDQTDRGAVPAALGQTTDAARSCFCFLKAGMNRMAQGRMRRVDEAVREVLSDAIAKDLKDPRIGFVTVTAVNTSRDLRHARVYVSVLGDDRERSATMDGLRSAHGFLQGAIASQLNLKHTPTLTFEYDETAERAARLTELMKSGPDRENGQDA